ncbi:hypothetical protein F4809DRAFT_234679 [Biscogniauxia mediterranea]|nr:hypothetical protein F4809DRAFT_234679 [Biscogniauxia mediterranea]
MSERAFGSGGSPWATTVCLRLAAHHPSIHPSIHSIWILGSCPDEGEVLFHPPGQCKSKKKKRSPIFATHSCPSEFMGRGALDRNGATCHTPMRIHEIRLFLASLGGVTTRNNERLKEKANYQTTTSTIYHSTPTICLLASSLLPPRTSSRWIRL